MNERTKENLTGDLLANNGENLRPFIAEFGKSVHLRDNQFRTFTLQMSNAVAGQTDVRCALFRMEILRLEIVEVFDGSFFGLAVFLRCRRRFNRWLLLLFFFFFLFRSRRFFSRE